MFVISFEQFLGGLWEFKGKDGHLLVFCFSGGVIEK